MSKKYSKDETIRAVKEAMGNDITALYNAKCINWKGETKGKDKSLYSEVISEELLKNNIADKIRQINPINREKSYKINHDGKTENITNRGEEIFAKKLFESCSSGKVLDGIGKIFDYQVPLKAKQADKAGKIDLVSFDRSKNVAHLLELKYGYNPETLLRCILEIATYYRLLNKDNFKKSYPEYDFSVVKKGILVFRDSLQHAEVKDIKSGNRPFLKKLLGLLKVEIFLIDCPMVCKVENLRL